MRHPSKQALMSAQTLDQLARHYDLTDAELALMTGIGRASMQQRRKGTRAIKLEDLPVLAGAFGVPVDVLLMDRYDAIRWVLENVDGGGFPARFDPPDVEEDVPSTKWYSGGARARLTLVGRAS